MLIKSIEVYGLPRHDRPIHAKLNSDLNIITGRNGAGKTTILKLLWYIISGNIGHAIKEVPFSRAVIETDAYTISISKGSDESRIEFKKDGSKTLFEDHFDDDVFQVISATEQANATIKMIGSSLFFPTFRRIEGGFSMGQTNHGIFRQDRRPRTDIEDAMLALSRRLSEEKHAFIAAISTGDIVTLLMRHYTEMSEASNDLQKNTSHEIIDQIKNYKEDNTIEFPFGKSKADTVIDNIKLMIEEMDEKRAKILAPLDAVKNLTEVIFHHTGIKLGTRLSFGDAATAVNSEILSAGEKQMLSFICYNAFNSNSVIFIDEPELSLHVDWQRQLFPTLHGQGTSNQFIVATHSPFIYSKYPDKEIMMSPDRGAESEEID